MKSYQQQECPGAQYRFGTRSVPVLWYIIKDECEAVLSGVKSKQLGIVKFKSTPDTFMLIKMIKLENKQNVQTILCKCPNNFKGKGKLQNHQVKLHIDSQVKPVAEPPKRIPYNLKERVADAIDEILANDVIEEHPIGEPAPLGIKYCDCTEG